MAEQGERYRIVAPQPPEGKRAPVIIGAGDEPDRYTSNLNGVTVEDIYGDVISCSENVDYPRGPDKNYRHPQWIEEHPNRFKLIEE